MAKTQNNTKSTIIFASIYELQASLKDDTTRNGNLAIHRNFKTT